MNLFPTHDPRTVTIDSREPVDGSIAYAVAEPPSRVRIFAVGLLSLKAGVSVGAMAILVTELDATLGSSVITTATLTSAAITAGANGACAVAVWRGSRTGLVFATFLSVLAFILAFTRPLGWLSTVSAIVSAFLLLALVSPPMWPQWRRSQPRAPRTRVVTYVAIAGIALGLVLGPVLVEASSGAEALAATISDDAGETILNRIPAADQNDFASFTGAQPQDLPCVMPQLFVEFGPQAFARWSASEPSAAEQTKITEIVSACQDD